MDVDSNGSTATANGTSKTDGIKQYYIAKIEELQLINTSKTQNLRRLEAQRNELNAKGSLHILVYH